MTTPIRVRTRLRGLAATLALVAFMLGVPTVLLAIDAIPDPGAFSWSRLTSPDDGTLVLQVIAVVCWVAWAIFTCQLIASIVSQIRGVRAPRVPGLVVPQFAADRLVAAAALLFVAIPTATAVFPQPKAEAAAVATPLPAAPVPAAPTGVDVATHATAPTKHEPANERYTVKRGDSLWKIAEQRLGDGSRYVELVDLNEPVLGGRPDFLVPGTVLKVPVAETPPEGEYVVQPGDTLSEIAEDELGNADAYPAIVEASRGITQADGAHLSDPDLILPGWRLTIPGPAQPVAALPPKHSAQRHDPRPVLPPATDSSAPPTADATGVPQTQADADRSGLPAWLLPGLAGTGAVFGAAFWIVLHAQRRTQLRWRRPGRIIAPPPPELVQAEKTARVTATSLAPRIEELDAALRSLEPTKVRILTVTLSGEDVGIALAEPAKLAAPWTGAGVAWRITLADVPEGREVFPPYPLLVSVGQDVDGAFVFLNLEELRVVGVTGDAERKAAFARHLAAELAVNPWSITTHVDLLGLGADLASFHLGRISTHPPGDTAFINALARHVGESVSGSDPDDFYAAIIATADRPHEALDELARALDGLTNRTAAALVDLAGEPRPIATDLQLTADGRLTCSSLGLDVAAAGLSEEEARACALLLDLTLDSHDVPVPRATDPTTTTADLGGALIEELTEPRAEEGPAGDASLLPLDAHVYADVAATTVEDIETLAPIAVPAAEATIARADPTLDEDLARWESPTLTSTKLTLLGPVGARTTGDAKTTAARRPYYVELLAYLLLHPDGSTADDLADAFGITPERARVSMSNLRRWLGRDPATELPYLPDAKQTHTTGTLAAYRVHGVLCDLDLFRRLRTRAQSRGGAGMDDLISALRLVTGEPFSRLQDRHWSWLLEGERWDHIMTSAIADVGHIVSAHALANNDSALALWAARTAYTAAPYDEVAQLDVIQAVAAGGDDEQAKKDLANKVFNRRDDDLPPIELPERTAKIVENKKWIPLRARPHRAG
ncbi:LysM peptidoglycan-binding domain-containing protein [Nocardioides ultimimeridianus]